MKLFCPTDATYLEMMQMMALESRFKLLDVHSLIGERVRVLKLDSVPAPTQTKEPVELVLTPPAVEPTLLVV